MRRRVFRLIIGLFVLLGLAALAVQIMLMTDLPRQMVLDALHENTGLRFEAASLSTGWRGRTELQSITVALPLERDPFLTISSLRITHTDLIRLILLRRIVIDEAIVETPHLVIRQDAAGAWNVARAAAITESVQIHRDSASRARQTFDLPSISIRNAQIDIHPAPAGAAHDRVITYAPLSIEGASASTLAWQFDARLGQEQIASGHLSPRGRWPHHFELDVQRVAPYLDPWRQELTQLVEAQPEDELTSQDDAGSASTVLEIPRNLSIAATWDGALTDNGVRGRLSIDRFIAAEMEARGAVTLAVAGSTLTIEPHDLAITALHPELESLRLLRGSVIHDMAAQQTRVSRLHAQSEGRQGHLAAQINGEWDGGEERGNASVRWEGRLLEWEADHDGAIGIHFTTPAVGPRTLDATLSTQGSTPQGTWDAEISLVGSGSSWNALRGRVAAKQFDIAVEEDLYDFSGLLARFIIQDRQLQLTDLDLPSAAHSDADASFRGRGVIHLDTYAWSADVAATNWTPPVSLNRLENAPLHFHLRASSATGDRAIELEQLVVTTQDGDFHLAGRYQPDDPSPLSARLLFDTRIPDASAMVTGQLHGEMNVSGELQPLQLQIGGIINAVGLDWNGRTFDEIAVRLDGEVDAESARFESDTFEFIGGTWQVTGKYGRALHSAALTVDADAADIERLVAMLGGPAGYAGTASLTVAVLIPDLEFSRAEVEGSWAADDLRGRVFRAESGSGKVYIAGQTAHFTDLVLEHGDGMMSGSAVMNLNDLSALTVDVAVTDWPLELTALDVTGRVSGDAALDIDLTDVSAVGDFKVVGSASLRDAPIGEFDLQAGILGRTIHLHTLHADVLGGETTGNGTLYLDPQQWSQSVLEAQWSGVDLGLLAQYSDRFLPLDGISSGTFSAQRTDDPRAVEPIRLNLSATLQDSHYGEIAIEAATVEAYLGRDRLMIQHATANLAGGTIDFWGRLTQHEGDPFVHVHVTLDDLDLEQIARFMTNSDERRPIPGRISGWGSVGGYLISPAIETVTTFEGEEVERMTGPRLFGQANLSIEQSDLVAVPGFAALYNVLRIDFGRSEPTGYGEAFIRLENNAIDIRRLTYFNRGTDIVARLRLENIWRGADSPISGVAAGVVRPLRDLDLPGVKSLDRLIGAIQTDTASVRIDGTIAERDIQVMPFADVTDAISRILGGRVNN